MTKFVTDLLTTSPPLPRVLAVDDISANLKLLQAILEPLECQVVLASSGDEALRLLLVDEFAVLVLDVQMPDMDGYEVAHYARQHPATRDVPIIFLTAAHRDSGDVLRGYGSGAVDFLFKPVDSTILRSKVRVFLDLYSNRRRIADAKRDLDRAYKELKATQAQLIQSAKMASLGQLVAGIAHELNNPLAFSLAHLETAKNSLARIEQTIGPLLEQAVPIEWKRGLNRLSEAVVGLERIRDVVSKLRVFSQLDQGEWKTVNVRECLESVLMLLRYRIVNRVSVSAHFEAPELFTCYPGLLNQAVLNLLANALDVTPQGGTITIRTAVVQHEYRISVADSGPGIPQELRDRIFEPFFTTKPVGRGTGLGLSITDSIVRLHGGTIAVECPDGGGAVIILRLPLMAGSLTKNEA